MLLFFLRLGSVPWRGSDSWNISYPSTGFDSVQVQRLLGCAYQQRRHLSSWSHGPWWTWLSDGPRCRFCKATPRTPHRSPRRKHCRHSSYTPAGTQCIVRRAATQRLGLTQSRQQRPYLRRILIRAAGDLRGIFHKVIIYQVGLLELLPAHWAAHHVHCRDRGEAKGASDKDTSCTR